MNTESEHTLLAKFLLTIGTFAAGLTLTDIDLYLSIGLKFISLASFLCYLLINQKAIGKGWGEFKNKFKKK